jgi:hypothetical protein
MNPGDSGVMVLKVRLEEKFFYPRKSCFKIFKNYRDDFGNSKKMRDT